jgi:hypothetical protein
VRFVEEAWQDASDVTFPTRLHVCISHPSYEPLRPQIEDVGTGGEHLFEKRE